MKIRAFTTTVLTASLGLAFFAGAEQQEAVLTLQHSADLQDWETIPVTEALVREDGTIRLPMAGTSQFFRLAISSADVSNEAGGDRFAPENIFDTTLDLTILTSTAPHVAPGTVDNFQWNADGSFNAGDDVSSNITYFAYARKSPVTGQINFTIVAENENIHGTIDLDFTSPKTGIFILKEGDLEESGTFVLEDKGSLGQECRPPLPNNILTGNLNFNGSYTSVEEGQLFEADYTFFEDDQLITIKGAEMKAQVSASVGQRDSFTETVFIDLNNNTINIFGSATALQPTSGEAYLFQLIFDDPVKLISHASNDSVQYYSQNTEIFEGFYDPCTRMISIIHTEIMRLTWNLTGDTSIATTKQTFVSTGN